MTNIEALVAEYGTVMKAYGRSLGVGDRLIAIDHSGSADRRFEAIRNALTEQAEAFKGELQAYDGMVRELTKTVEDMQAAQFVPVVGEPAGYFPDESRADEIDAPPLPVYFAPTHSITAAELATLRELTKTVEDMRAMQAVPVVGEPTDAAYKWMIANGVEPLTSLHKLGERLAAFLDEDQFSGCETLLLTAITAINTFVPVPAAELATLREKAAEADELRKDAEKWRDLCSRAGADPSGTISYAGPLEGAPEDWAAIAQGKGE